MVIFFCLIRAYRCRSFSRYEKRWLKTWKSKHVYSDDPMVMVRTSIFFFSTRPLVWGAKFRRFLIISVWARVHSVIPRVWVRKINGFFFFCVSPAADGRDDDYDCTAHTYDAHRQMHAEKYLSTDVTINNDKIESEINTLPSCSPILIFKNNTNPLASSILIVFFFSIIALVFKNGRRDEKRRTMFSLRNIGNRLTN